MNKTQALEAQLATATDPVVRIDLLNALAIELRISEPERALALCQEANQLAQSSEFYPKGLAESHYAIGLCHVRLGNFAQCLEHSLASTQHYTALGDLKRIADSLDLVGLAYTRLGNPAEGLEYHLRSLNLFQQLNDKKGIATALNGIAIVYENLGDHQQALDYFQQSLAIDQETDDKPRQALMLANVALAQRNLGNFEAALACSRQGMQIAEAVGHQIYAMFNLEELANTYAVMGRTAEALACYTQTVEHARGLNDKFNTASMLREMSRLHVKIGEWETAERFIQEALEIVQVNGMKGVQFEAHEILAQIYKARGDFEHALFHYEQFHTLREQVFNEQADAKLKNLEVVHRTESARKTAELLQTKNQELEQEIGERKRVEAALLEAKERAEVANRAKSEFLSNMSHELRTPLNAVLGFAQLLHRNVTLDRDGREYLSIIQRSGEHLLALINNVLDLSKIESGRMTVNAQNFDLSRLLADLEDMFYLRAQAKHLQLLFTTASAPRYIRSDEVKLRQILINLLSNALKFTQTGRVCIEVAERSAEQDGTQRVLEGECTANLYFAVEDTGPGIAPEELNLLFQPFIQTKSGRDLQEGSGLGLSISQRYVQLLGGELQVQSELNRGTRVSFQVPVTLVPASTIVEHTPIFQHVLGLAPGQPRYRLLVVDDSSTNRQLLVKLLTPLGFEVGEASNGQEAIAWWQRWQPHLIWMDIRMPVMDGYAATQHIKRQRQGQDVVIIALTASVLEEDHRLILAAGCDDFLRKPFREQDIFAILEKRLGVRWLEAEVSGSAETPESNPEQVEIDLPRLDNLPASLLAELRQALLHTDMAWIDRTIAMIQQHDHSIANELADLAQDFRYDHILALLQTLNVKDNV